MHWAVKPARIIWAMPRASLRSVWLIRAFNTARMCHWDEGIALAEKALKLAGPSAVPYWWWPKAKRAWSRGEYAEAYEAFQRAYIESFWLSHLDLAYTLPFLGRVDEAKQHVAALLKMYPTMTIREADSFYKLACFDPAYREKMVGALREAGLPE
jgi:tetratricopeptide (TPR) repeat protein